MASDRPLIGLEEVLQALEDRDGIRQWANATGQRLPYYAYLNGLKAAADYLESVFEHAQHDFELTAMPDGSVMRIHAKEDCVGTPCPFHNATDHHMVTWPMVWRGDRGFVERTCPHGIGHPDPDSMAFLVRQSTKEIYAGVHGCDGCCLAPDDEGTLAYSGC